MTPLTKSEVEGVLSALSDTRNARTVDMGVVRAALRSWLLLSATCERQRGALENMIGIFEPFASDEPSRLAIKEARAAISQEAP